MDFIKSWETRLPDEKSKLEVFIDTAPKAKGPSLNEMAYNLDREVFSRISCLECANCCRTTPALLTEKDIKRIATYLGIPAYQFRRRYVLRDLNGELCFRKVPCVFLEEDNRCAVYEVRPASCRDYPHLSSGSFLQRKRLHKANLSICPAAFEIIRQMEKLS